MDRGSEGVSLERRGDVGVSPGVSTLQRSLRLLGLNQILKFFFFLVRMPGSTGGGAKP